MISRCDACLRPFVASRPGPQPCPHCGASVDVDAPPGVPREASPPPPAEAPPPPLRSPVPPAHPPFQPVFSEPLIPEPSSVGFFTTLKFVLGAPRRFFDELSPQSPIRNGVRFGFVAALAGIMGSSLRSWVTEPTPLPTDTLSSLPQEVQRCALEQQAAWDVAIEPFLLARLPLAPVLALLLTYGLVSLFHVLARAMGNTTTPFPIAARNIGYAMAPLVMAALPFMAFGGCFLWSLVLCGISLKRTYALTTLLAALLAAFPFFLWMLVELMLAMRLALPCIPLM